MLDIKIASKRSVISMSSRGPGRYSALLMPPYVCCLSKAMKSFDASVLIAGGRRIQRALEYVHSKGYVHMDVKTDNIFIDWKGLWFLGDFGSAVKIGQTVKSTTETFTTGGWFDRAAKIEFDWFMLATMLVLVSLPDKTSWRDLLTVEPRNRWSSIHCTYEKVKSAAESHLADPAMKAFVTDLLELCSSLS